MSEGHKRNYVSKECIELKEIEEKKAREAEVKQFEELSKVGKDALGDKVDKLVASNRVTNSPCVLVTCLFGWSSANIERIVKVYALCDSLMLSYMAPKMALELKQHNAIIKELKRKVTEAAADKSVRRTTYLLFETPVSFSTSPLPSPSALTA